MSKQFSILPLAFSIFSDPFSSDLTLLPLLRWHDPYCQWLKNSRQCCQSFKYSSSKNNVEKTRSQPQEPEYEIFDSEHGRWRQERFATQELQDCFGQDVHENIQKLASAESITSQCGGEASISRDATGKLELTTSRGVFEIRKKVRPEPILCTRL